MSSRFDRDLDAEPSLAAKETGGAAFEPIAVASVKVGSHVGVTAPLTIEQPMVDAFASITRDTQWIHTDAERAGRGPFGATVVHGYLLLSLLPSMGRELISLTSDGAAAVNYGLGRVRFTRPLRVGDACVDHIRLEDVADRARGTLFTLEHRITDPEGGVLYCVAQTLTLVIGEAAAAE